MSLHPRLYDYDYDYNRDYDYHDRETTETTETMETMETDKFCGKYRAASTRLQTWDYAWAGHYFITICTKNRQNFFGNIKDGTMHLNELGEIAKKYWLEIPCHFDNAKIDAFIVMPNHVHGIIVLENTHINPNGNIENNNGNVTVETRQCLVSHAETRHCLVSTSPSRQTRNRATDIGKNRFQNQGSKSVSSIIGSYKSICTKTINRTPVETRHCLVSTIFAWQSRFYEHIIRDEKSLENIRNYIINNPEQWEDDENNPLRKMKHANQ